MNITDANLGFIFIYTHANSCIKIGSLLLLDKVEQDGTLFFEVYNEETGTWSVPVEIDKDRVKFWKNEQA